MKDTNPEKIKYIPEKNKLFLKHEKILLFPNAIKVIATDAVTLKITITASEYSGRK